MEEGGLTTIQFRSSSKKVSPHPLLREKRPRKIVKSSDLLAFSGISYSFFISWRFDVSNASIEKTGKRTEEPSRDGG